MADPRPFPASTPDLDLGGELHHQALELKCVEALARGDPDAAFRFADRRCRIRPLPDAHSFVLRAEALHRLGERDAALAALETALQIAPDDVAANRRLLSLGSRERRCAAADALVRCDEDPQVLRRAIKVLRDAGRPSVARLEHGDTAIEGWVAWTDAEPVALVLHRQDGARAHPIEAEKDHPHSDRLTKAASFSLPLADTADVLRVAVRAAAEEIASLPLLHRQAPSDTSAMEQGGKNDTDVTVILPVFGDLAATRACLDSLAGEFDGDGRRLLIVDDASPDPDIRRLVDAFSAREHVALIRNPHNLGFVGAVNSALAAIAEGDVILLNSDTVVPRGFIDRLQAAARSSVDIATVTPLSNNGEFTSFPVPNRSNPLPPREAIIERDSIAASVNANGVVDIPNGIGFCMYVTRAALAAVGPLSANYRQGYLEDVDFCLRAREKGFRNVCATGVYVGHAGSRSFGAQKRALVVRNLAVIEARFPDYRRECAAFMRTDPLKTARQALEFHLPRPKVPKVLLVCGAGAVVAIARQRAAVLTGDGTASVLLLEIAAGAPAFASLSDTAGDMPQSLEFALSSSAGLDRLASYLRSANVTGAEFLELAVMPHALVERLVGMGIRYDVTIATAPWHHGAAQDPWLRHLLGGASRIFTPDDRATAAVFRLRPDRAVLRIGPQGLRRRTRLQSRTTSCLGIVPIRGDAAEYRRMRLIIVGVRRMQPALSVVVLGRTADDRDLMRDDGVFVTGEIGPGELPAACMRYRLTALFVCLAEPLFGHPLAQAVLSTGLSVAAFDWFDAPDDAAPGDLALASGLPPEEAARRLAAWLQDGEPLARKPAARQG